MKVSFSKSQSYTPEWQGNRSLPEAEQCSCTLAILDMDALMSLLDAFTAVGMTGTVDTDSMDSSKMKPLLEEFGNLLPKHVTGLTGLFDLAGAAISVDDVVTYPKFLNLAMELLMKLSEISSPSDDDVGNSNEPPVLEQLPTVNGSQAN